MREKRKDERAEGQRWGGREGKLCINYGLVTCLKIQTLLLLKRWQNKWHICNFKIAFLPF